MKWKYFTSASSESCCASVTLQKWLNISCAVVPGDNQKVEIPKGEMEVVKGQMVMLQAWYSPNSDISKNSVVWLFMGNGSEQVRRSKHKSSVISCIVNPALTAKINIIQCVCWSLCYCSGSVTSMHYELNYELKQYFATNNSSKIAKNSLVLVLPVWGFAAFLCFTSF